MLTFYLYDMRTNDKSFIGLYLAFLSSIFVIYIIFYIPAAFISNLGNLKSVRDANIEISDKSLYYRVLVDKDTSLLKEAVLSIKEFALLLILTIFSLSIFFRSYIFSNNLDEKNENIKNLLSMYVSISYLLYIFSVAILIGYSGRLIAKYLYILVIFLILVLLLQGMTHIYSYILIILFIIYLIFIYKRWGLIENLKKRYYF